MSQFETTGGGFIDSGDRRIERKVVVAVGGAALTVPASDQGFPLSNVSVTQEPGGVRRGVFEFSRAGDGGASYNQYGKRIELTGGTREVPIFNHKLFEDLTDQQIADVQTAVDAKSSAGLSAGAMSTLYGFLSRKIEYVLAPAIVGRITEVESDLPNLSPIAKLAEPTGLTAPNGTFWINTAITATPIGDRYEVTREYTLNFSSFADVQALYGD
jgi:hypothetical protein